MIVDGVLINTIEYLSGQTVMGEVHAPPDGLLAFELINATNATLHVPLQDGTMLPVSMIRVSRSECELRDPHGVLLGTAVTAADGSLHLCNAARDPVSIIEADELASVRAGAESTL